MSIKISKNILLLLSLTLFFISSANAKVPLSITKHQKLQKAPHYLTGQVMVLQIENIDTELTDRVPSQGVIVQQYYDQHSYTTYGLGGKNHYESSGRYHYKKTSNITAAEKTTDVVTGDMFTTQYLFENKNSGTWQRKSKNNDIKLSGHFMLSAIDTPESMQLAEEDHNGLTVSINILNAESALIPKEYFPSRAVVLQSYNKDGTYSATGFGPSAIDHHGTYDYQKISANVAIEQTIQIAESITAPYTLVYFYHTPTSGSWYQNFGNGTIIFSGIFSTFETQ